MNNLEPIGDWIFILPLPMKEVRKSGIITDLLECGDKMRKQKAFIGRVVGISPKWRHLIPLESLVIYDQWNGGYWVPTSAGSGEEFFVTKVTQKLRPKDPRDYNVWAVVDEEAIIEIEREK